MKRSTGIEKRRQRLGGGSPFRRGLVIGSLQLEQDDQPRLASGIHAISSDVSRISSIPFWRRASFQRDIPLCSQATKR